MSWQSLWVDTFLQRKYLNETVIESILINPMELLYKAKGPRRNFPLPSKNAVNLAETRRSKRNRSVENLIVKIASNLNLQQARKRTKNCVSESYAFQRPWTNRQINRCEWMHASKALAQIGKWRKGRSGKSGKVLQKVRQYRRAKHRPEEATWQPVLHGYHS